MNPIRKRRLQLIVFALAGVVATAAVSLVALRQNIDHFYPPHRIVSGDAPVEVRIRAGGYVEPGSIEREAEGLGVRFLLTDRAGASFQVAYDGLLPSLFKEDQGSIVVGRLAEDGLFKADQVLARHDENYTPPELKDLDTIP
ncbi:MAG: cytochrome c maturation protein CcmE [Pseudomonadales bacterium]|nr:cytochrome c maturation protein CcmE [Pseudomonadales bacterium]